MKNRRLRFLILLLFLTGSVSARQATKSPVKLTFEKVYLHTDREYYWGGENIWFKAYLINGQTNLLSASSNSLTVELINSRSEVVLKELIYIKNGVGKGDFKLAPDIKEGSYRIKAYTTFMTYFGDNLLFEKPIHIYSTQAVSTSPGPSQNTSNNVLPALAASTSLASDQNSIRFFPESGSMIDDVNGFIAFKAQLPNQKGIALSGNVVSSSGLTVANFECDSLGIGKFAFKPSANLKYVAKGKFSNGQSFEAELPQALLQGFSIHTEVRDSAVVITLSTNENTLKEMQNKEFSIAGKSKGRAYFSKKIIWNGTQSSFAMEKGNFPAGISDISLVDETAKPYCERLIYIENSKKPDLQISLDKAVYKPREKATVSIKVTDQDKKPVLANVSVAVLDAETVPENAIDIVSYLELQSELKGNIPNVRQYFDKNNPNRFKQMDLLLLTQGWRDFTWRRLVDSALRVSTMQQSSTVLSSSAELVKLKSRPEELLSKTNSLNDTIQLNQVVIKAEKKVRLLDQTFSSYGKDQVFSVEPKDYDHKNLRHYLMHYSSDALTDQDDNIYFVGVNGKASYPRLVVDDVSLPFTNEVNDIPVRDAYYNKYLNMPVSAFEKIVIKRGVDRSVDQFINASNELVQGGNFRRYQIGDVYVMFLTTNSAISRNQLNALKAEEKAFYESRDFYAPNYEEEIIDKDLRTTIHWVPNIITNESGELQLSFYNSALPHKIMVVVEGITEASGPISSKAVFNVKQ